MLYLLVPWSAINLTDFYLVRRGQYDVDALFEAQGRYRRWAWPGLLAYLGGLLCMLPFFALGDYLGPAVAALRYADVAFLVGFFSSGLCYGLLVWGADLNKVPEHQQP